MQYARTSEAPTAEGWDWRAILLRREAIQSSKTHRREGAPYGKRTGLIEPQVHLKMFQFMTALGTNLYTNFPVTVTFKCLIYFSCQSLQTFLQMTALLSPRMPMWSAAPVSVQGILVWLRCSFDRSWLMRAPRPLNQSAWYLLSWGPNRYVSRLH